MIPQRRQVREDAEMSASPLRLLDVALWTTMAPDMALGTEPESEFGLPTP